jgi:signal transduction histidine kinase
MTSSLDEIALLRAELERERASHLRTRRASELGASELQHANAELSAIFVSLPDLFLRIDARGMVVDHKGGGGRALDHLLAPDPWNVPLGECIVAGAAEALERALMKLSAGEPARVEYALAPESNPRWFEARAVSLPNRDTLLVITEITERTRANLALLKEQDDRARELHSFAMAASHDLLAPLRNIESIAEWLEEDVDDATALRGHLDLLTKRVSYLRRMLDGMLDYARAGAQHVAAAEEVDVDALAREVIDVAGAELFEQRLSNLPTLITGRVPLERVLQNLVSNAVKYHDACPGSIAISCADAGDFFAFSVSDDGPGIAERDHERAFALFGRVNHHAREGAGVGLAVVRRLVRRLGGEVTLSSNAPRGLCVAFTWPKRWPHTSSFPTALRVEPT